MWKMKGVPNYGAGPCMAVSPFTIPKKRESFRQSETPRAEVMDACCASSTSSMSSTYLDFLLGDFGLRMDEDRNTINIISEDELSKGDLLDPSSSLASYPGTTTTSTSGMLTSEDPMENGDAFLPSISPSPSLHLPITPTSPQPIHLPTSPSSFRSISPPPLPSPVLHSLASSASSKTKKKKKKMFEMDPLSDDEEERRRQNAINAKKNRDMKKQEMMEMKQRISALEEVNQRCYQAIRKTRSVIQELGMDVQQLKMTLTSKDSEIKAKSLELRQQRDEMSLLKGHLDIIASTLDDTNPAKNLITGLLRRLPVSPTSEAFSNR